MAFNSFITTYFFACLIKLIMINRYQPYYIGNWNPYGYINIICI